MINLQYFSTFLALFVVGIASGQTGMLDEFGDLLPAPPPPAMKISEVVKEQTFEHHVAPSLRPSPPPMAPAPGPAAGAPAPGLLSVYDMEPPEQRKVVGVAHVAMPAAGPTLLPSNLTVAGDRITQTGLPAVAIETMPSDAPLSISPDDNATLKAVQTFAPPAPVAFVSADGSLIFVGPASPSGYVGNASAGPTHWLWPTVALIGFIGIVGSILWAYSKNRQRRYIDLKDTEMAMQNRPHSSV
ncbi:g6438 [Coccomyxa elongata]